MSYLLTPIGSTVTRPELNLPYTWTYLLVSELCAGDEIGRTGKFCERCERGRRARKIKELEIESSLNDMPSLIFSKFF